MKKIKEKNIEYIVDIDIERCKGCELCLINCPKNKLKISNKLNKLGYKYIEVDEKVKCSGCGLCYLICPDYVISIRKK